MHDAVGTATSDCKVTEKQFAIVFYGEYNPNVEKKLALTTLSRIVSNYDKPDLGGYECSRNISDRDGGIFITLEYSGNNYKSACGGILSYLNQSKFLVCKLI